MARYMEPSFTRVFGATAGSSLLLICSASVSRCAQLGCQQTVLVDGEQCRTAQQPHRSSRNVCSASSLRRSEPMFLPILVLLIQDCVIRHFYGLPAGAMRFICLQTSAAEPDARRYHSATCTWALSQLADCNAYSCSRYVQHPPHEGRSERLAPPQSRHLVICPSACIYER